MLSFESDYTTGAHPQVLKRLVETNLEPLSGYGSDPYCASAKEKILRACGLEPGTEEYEAAAVEFLVGGTQTNQIVISTLLRDYEGVIAADTGHISVHEAGAVEYSGHKVLVLPPSGNSSAGAGRDSSAEAAGRDSSVGKISPASLRKYVELFYADENHEHMVFPGMVYLSQPTEYGTLYTKAELEEIAQICRQYGMRLYIDGARLGYALASPGCDLSLPDIARLADAFYIGGTKIGALCGEAVVFTGGSRPAHFINSMKKRGGLLAKGRLQGVQFDALFSEYEGDILYLSISRHVIRMTREMCAVLHRCAIPFFLESPTNQQFVILENEAMERLSSRVAFSFWEKFDETRTVVRFAAGWSTTEEDLRELEKVLVEVLQ